jgi:trehalose-phosphatase
MGDDWTDEPAFRTANARGGRSVRIGRDKRATEANEYLADPAAVRQWLSLLVRQ